METVTKRLYEGMFLVDSAQAASDWNGVNDAIEKVLKKNGAEIVSIRKWEDRRLAYEINRKSRGTYILTYFNVAPDQLDAIERAVQLSEMIIRVLILRTDKMTQEDMDKPTPAMATDTRQDQEPDEENEETDSKTDDSEVPDYDSDSEDD